MNPVLILSIGHYPAAGGAKWHDLIEHTEIFRWMNFIYGRLSKYNDISTHLVDVGKLTAKVNQVNEIVRQTKVMRAVVPILAVELHFNAAGSTYVSGNETLYYPGSVTGKAAAHKFNDEFIEYAEAQYGMHIKNRGAKEGWYWMDRPNVVDYSGDVDGDEKPDYFLRKTSCTSLILEPHFLCELEGMDDWHCSATAVAEALRSTVKCLTQKLN